MRMILFLACCALVNPTFGQATCFNDCFAAFEIAKSATLTRSVESSIEITNRIVQGLVGCNAPEFDVVAVDGKRLKLSAMRGKVVVLNFWFIGCAPCIAELPALNRLVEEYKGQEVAFIAFGRDEEPDIREFLAKRKFNYNIVSSDIAFANSYCIIAGWPTSMVLDKTGAVRKVFSGGFVNEKALTHAYDEIKPVVDEYLGLDVKR